MKDKCKNLVIVGAGETALLAQEYFSHDSDREVVAFAVDSTFRNESTLMGLPVLTLEDLLKTHPPEEFDVFIAIGSNHLNRDRAQVYQAMKDKGYSCASYVSSRAFVWPNVTIGENCFILEDNTLQPFVEIGDNVTLWSGNHIGHRSKIMDHVFVSSHCVISGFCEIGAFSFLGVNCCVADQVSIGPSNFIGLGCIINRSTPEDAVYSPGATKVSKVAATKLCRVKNQ